MFCHKYITSEQTRHELNKYIRYVTPCTLDVLKDTDAEAEFDTLPTHDYNNVIMINGRLTDAGALQKQALEMLCS